MNTSTKKLLILGLCSGLGRMLMDQAEDGQVRKHAEKFNVLADQAIQKTAIKVTFNGIKRIKAKIDKLYADKEEFNVVEALSFCILGLMDLQHYSGEGTPIDAILLHAMVFTKYWDPELQDEDAHSAATKKYLEWLK